MVGEALDNSIFETTADHFVLYQSSPKEDGKASKQSPLGCIEGSQPVERCGTWIVADHNSFTLSGRLGDYYEAGIGVDVFANTWLVDYLSYRKRFKYIASCRSWILTGLIDAPVSS